MILPCSACCERTVVITAPESTIVTQFVDTSIATVISELMSVSLFLPVCLALVGSPRVPTRSSTPRAPVPSSALRDLDEASWCEAIAGASNLAVVCFHAPWCKTCLATAPTYERIAYQFRDRADFFRCDFKKHRSLCLRERVFALPNCPSVCS